MAIITILIPILLAAFIGIYSIYEDIEGIFFDDLLEFDEEDKDLIQ